MGGVLCHTIRRKIFIFEQQLNYSFWDWDEEDKLLLHNWKENKKRKYLIYSKIKEYDVFDDEKVKSGVDCL
ncbi:hypothetical protein OM428_09010 [Enterococcus gallinarum]|nr:hypothetical protein [Enterococcus gallinarum]